MKIVLGTLFLGIFLLSFTSAAWCYQESANVSTDCGGFNNGIYAPSGTWTNPANLYDGVWASYSNINTGNNYLYINYTKPTGALNSSLWQVKDESGIYNLTIAADCWNYNNNLVILRAELTGSTCYWYCYQGGWRQLRENIGSTYVSEEGMEWDMPTLVDYNKFSLKGLSKFSLKGLSKFSFLK